jgi:hypothetical protein
MAKRESKGQQVKTFKHFEPQPDLTHEEVIGKVYFEADCGDFVVYMPEHIANVVDTLEPVKAGNLGFHVQARVRSDMRTIRSKIMQHVIDAYDTIRKEYVNSLKLLRGDKVLVVYFKRNLPWRNDRKTIFAGGGATGGNDISFCGQPTIHLNYGVFWRVGDELYHKDHHEAYRDRPAYDVMRYKQKLGAENGHAVPWTQEREDFIAGVHSKLIDLGWLLSDFLGDLEANINHAIESGARFLAIAPPKEDADAE